MFLLRLLADLAFDRRSGLQLVCALLDGTHDAKKVAAVDLLDVGGRVTFLKQRTREHRELVIGAKLGGNAAYPVEGRAASDMGDGAQPHPAVRARNHTGPRR